MTPPNVLGAPKPWSSVIMSSTLGAPFGGTMRGGHQGFEVRSLFVDHTAEFRNGGWNLFSGNCRGGAGAAGYASCLLSVRIQRRECQQCSSRRVVYMRRRE